MIVVSGDGFLDQEDLNFEWNTNGLPKGEYTIYAQSTNPEGISGPIDVTNITLDKTQSTNLTFNHKDYLLVPNFPHYPASPIAKIMSVSEGDLLGKDDYSYSPTEDEAYCNDFYGYA
ncbi:MAG: peptidase C25, partial [Candidatus Thermoplasmatota archaeon]|nr:peptidase C25 [Candidatus Thermoplasmatota archaeon]